MDPTVRLPRDEELPADIREALQGLPPANVFRMLANAPASFHGFVKLALSILLESELDARKREIAVLRVAHVTGSRYEWTQHVDIARRVGVTQHEIDCIGRDAPLEGLDDESRLICRVADEISRDVRLSDAALESILARYGVRQATELILCCAYFNMLSRFLESTRVPLEGGPVLPEGAPWPDREGSSSR